MAASIDIAETSGCTTIWLCSATDPWRTSRLYTTSRCVNYRECLGYADSWQKLPFKVDEWPWHSARIPLSAFVTNVISGFEQFYDVPTPVP